MADHVPACIERVEGPPVVVKLIRRDAGHRCRLGGDQAAAHSVVEAFHGLEQNILIQKIRQGSERGRHRALVVGRRVVAGHEAASAARGVPLEHARGGSA